MRRRDAFGAVLILCRWSKSIVPFRRGPPNRCVAVEVVVDGAAVERIRRVEVAARLAVAVAEVEIRKIRWHNWPLILFDFVFLLFFKLRVFYLNAN